MHTVEEARTRIEREYGENAKYILNCYEVRDALEGVERSIKNENTLLKDHYFDSAMREAKFFNERRLSPINIKVGDGVTVHLWSDAHAATVIKKTRCTITVQYDKATLSPDFKPEFVTGGFCAHCTNQNEQTYTYEKDENGRIETYRWSDKRIRYQGGGDGSIYLTKGRHEFYDYNF